MLFPYDLHDPELKKQSRWSVSLEPHVANIVISTSSRRLRQNISISPLTVASFATARSRILADIYGEMYVTAATFLKVDNGAWSGVFTEAVARARF